ncbi:hypothetical protein KC669_01250 [Candidatus Dojkabacteria bacterium]|uniref:Uncharacterized protein n=1 Tax=Candidatus Dojkabacteria bacterium TaxID=2099670 RepID=A0A955LAM6_9BACT|nr:hypothetical protein [Candidatus Dojkabacteria bacterium]
MKGFPLTDKIKITSIIVLGITTFVLLFLCIFWFIIYFVQGSYTNIVLLNFYGKDLVAKVQDKEIELGIMQIKNMKIRNLPSNATIEFYDLDGNLVDKKATLELNNTPNLVIEPVTRNRDFCFIKADVTNFYFFKGDEKIDLPNLADLELLEKVNRNSNNKIYTGKDIYVYPGHADLSVIPTELKPDQRIIGFYPISCLEIVDPEAVHKTILLYKHYNEESQRAIVEKGLEEVENLTISDL